MHHAPPNYQCPFCLIARGDFDDRVLSRPSDIVVQTGKAIALVAAHWYPNNPGHVLVMPTEHFENIFELPVEFGAEIFAVSQRVAIAMKRAYGCAGISTRQHNEPAGNQDVWHFHQHVIARWPTDNLYASFPCASTYQEREPYAAKLREIVTQK